MLFSHHSHSLLHEYVSTGNEVELEKKSWRLQRQTHGASPSSFLFILSCTDSLSWAVRELLLSPMGSAADSTCSTGPEKPTNKGQQGSTGANGAGVTTKENDLEYKMVTDYLYYIHKKKSKPIHSLNRIADESRWHLFTLTVMLRSEVLLAASPPPLVDGGSSG